ncbi:G-protein coupled receptor Mth2-like [Cylas formicarius]|uniref:G-protein coupled receptor Mth2-like n=1 Tax=Cylas formicarius TaxID=197179 RepID=UPI002958357B|nr:G-protein coupled receptor Mth2-like [Cylas formicarius]
MIITPVVVCALLLNRVTASEDQLAKCCSAEDNLVKVKAGFTCQPDSRRRLQILTEENNFLNGSVSGECVEVTGDNFLLYEVKKEELNAIAVINETLFPKCCPLGFVYDHDRRSCAIGNNISHDFIKGNYLSVGLPTCKIILDKFYKSVVHIETILDLDVVSEGSFCLDQNSKGGFVVRECQDNLSICQRKRCIRKCCPDGQSYVGGANCMDTHVYGVQIASQHFSDGIEDPEDNFEVIYDTRCPRVTLLANNTISYTIDKDGVFKYYHNYSGTFIEKTYDHPQSYCIEHAVKKEKNIAGYHIFNCHSQTEVIAKFEFTLWAKIASVIFLVITIVCYIAMGETRNTFGKILINYCVAMMLLMLILTIAHRYLIVSRIECKIRGYSIILFNSALFAWLNIMSLDIWFTFGTPKRSIGRDQRKKDLKKILLYCLYGWGMPIFHTLLILTLETFKILPESIQPYVGIFFCILEKRNYAHIVFLLVPQLILQIINTILFIKTITYCINVKNEISKMNDTKGRKEKTKFAIDKDRLSLIIKLAVIMGVIFVFEVISAFFDMNKISSFTKNFEIVMDTITCLQGVFIFVIFIFKKKTLHHVKLKLGLSERRTSYSTSLTSHLPPNGVQMDVVGKGSVNST